MMAIGMQHNINRCTVCNNPKDDKRHGPCCICVANGKAPLPVYQQQPRKWGKSPMGGVEAEYEAFQRERASMFAREAYAPPQVMPSEPLVVNGIEQVFEAVGGEPGKVYQVPRHSFSECAQNGCVAIEDTEGNKYFKHFIKLTEEMAQTPIPYTQYGDPLRKRGHPVATTTEGRELVERNWK